jgi:hypothetical protein
VLVQLVVNQLPLQVTVWAGDEPIDRHRHEQDDPSHPRILLPRVHGVVGKGVVEVATAQARKRFVNASRVPDPAVPSCG